MRECPKCKTKEYNNRAMVMMVNECGHPLCKNCVDNIFARNAGPCPTCQKTLKKSSFWEQTLDDPMMERENFIRGRVRKTYNLKQDDFASLCEYNDYLERVETIVYSLIDGIDVEAIEAEILRFKDEHHDQIDRNRRRMDEDQMWIEAQLREEKEMHKRLQISREEQKAVEAAKMEAKKKRDAIINELKESNTHAEIILDRVRKEQIEREMAEREEELRIKAQEKHEREQRRLQAQTMSFGPVRQMGKPYHHVPPQLTLNGPLLPPVEHLEGLGYLQYIRQASNRRLAGGYTSALGCMRALTEARVDLFAF
ncbi:hypothetical protein QR680_008060 [Steinernema hermaphroditum]|uniref:RING-type domain-containing protein n=1 Tax=Steinernema hermaphroditum TaxID=289476 RepID=A0AA39M7E8_9BILA|nr:hypothetical protein QR680_008060 [Steinernema hermaphroditum]